MGKQKTLSKLADSQAEATTKFVRVPPRKARLVMDAVRGKYVSDALAVLKFVPNFAARAIEKTIKSAVANAENGRPFTVDGKPMAPLVTENLKLVRGQVDEGPRIKRIQPRAQGRAYRIVKRMCHIHVIVEEVEPKPSKVRRVAAGRRARAAGRTGATSRPVAQKAAIESPVQEQAAAGTPEAPETIQQPVAPVEEAVAEVTAAVTADDGEAHGAPESADDAAAQAA